MIHLHQSVVAELGFELVTPEENSTHLLSVPYCSVVVECEEVWPVTLYGINNPRINQLYYCN